MTKVLLINDSTSNSNWGDRAAATALMAMIRGAGGDLAHAVTEDNLRFSDFRAYPSLLDAPAQRGLRGTAKLLIPPILLGLLRRLLPAPGSVASGLIPGRWEDFDACAQRVLRETGFAWPELLAAMQGVDVAVIHGDGAMVGNGVIPRTDLFLAYLLKKHFSKPVAIVNHTADFDHPDLRRMAENVYPLFDDVVFRDPISEEKCRGMCGGRFAPDTAFLFEPAEKTEWAALAARPTHLDVWPNKASFDPREPYLCIGGSSILCTAWQPGAIARDFLGLVQQIRSSYAGQVVLTASDVSEQVVFEPVAAELGLPLLGVATPVQQAVDVLGNADAYVGGRWHPAIFALRGGAPVVPLSAKTFKMESLMRSAGLPDRTFDALALGACGPELRSLLRDHLDQLSELRPLLRKWAAEEAAASWDNVSFIRRLVADPAGRGGQGRAG